MMNCPPEPAESAGWSWKKGWVPVALLCALALGWYHAALHLPLLADDYSFCAYGCLDFSLPSTVGGLCHLLQTGDGSWLFQGAGFRPLTQWPFTLCYYTCDGNPTWIRLWGILACGLTSAGIYTWLRRAKCGPGAAAVGAVAYIVLPQTVLWSVYPTQVLNGYLVLQGVLLLLLHQRNVDQETVPWVGAGLMALLGMVLLLQHETTVPLLVAFGLLALARQKSLKWLAGYFTPSVLALLLYFVVRRLVTGSPLGTTAWAHTSGGSLLGAPGKILQWVFHVISTFGHHFFPLPQANNPGQLLLLSLPWVVIGLLGLRRRGIWKTEPVALLGGMLLLTVPLFAECAPRLWYFPSMFMCLLLGVLVNRLWNGEIPLSLLWKSGLVISLILFGIGCRLVMQNYLAVMNSGDRPNPLWFWDQSLFAQIKTAILKSRGKEYQDTPRVFERTQGPVVNQLAGTSGLDRGLWREDQCGMMERVQAAISAEQREVAAQLGLPPVVACPQDGKIMVLIPPTRMRVHTGPDEPFSAYSRGDFDINTPAFYADAFEVRTSDYLFAKCIQAVDLALPLTGRIAHTNQWDLPVGSIEIKAAQAYAAWAGKRVPTETEWEALARGTGGAHRFPWGDQFETGRAHVAIRGVNRGVVSVGTFPPNGFGIFDAIGNAWEMTVDHWRQRFPGADHDPESLIIVKGGGAGAPWWSARLRHRLLWDANQGLPNIGFRCVANLETVREWTREAR